MKNFRNYKKAWEVNYINQAYRELQLGINFQEGNIYSNEDSYIKLGRV
jgi:uncharacterized protein YpmB